MLCLSEYQVCTAVLLQRQLYVGAGMYRDVIFNGPSNCADAVADAISLFEVSNYGSPIPHISAKGNVACRVADKVIQPRDFIIPSFHHYPAVRTPISPELHSSLHPSLIHRG